MIHSEKISLVRDKYFHSGTSYLISLQLSKLSLELVINFGIFIALKALCKELTLLELY